MSDNRVEILELQRDLARLSERFTNVITMNGAAIQALSTGIQDIVSVVKNLQDRVEDLERAYVKSNPEPTKH
jgi:predicted translin family RNA/ssDNA-binding protein